MADLFVYGTLMCADILKAVAGELPARAPGILRGYRRFEVRGERYPAIMAVEGWTVEGLVCFDIGEESWNRLDRFEGVMYLRRLVEVERRDGGSGKAYAYVVRPEFEDRLGPGEWSFETFRKNGKSDFISGYRGYDVLDDEQG